MATSQHVHTLDYVGPIPGPGFFGVDIMTGDKSEKFWQWYRAWPQDKPYDLREEAILYCRYSLG